MQTLKYLPHHKHLCEQEQVRFFFFRSALLRGLEVVGISMARESTPEADRYEPFLEVRWFSGIFSSSFSLLMSTMLISRKQEKTAGLAGDERVMSIV
jgi:hypothetical protein